MGGYGDSRRDKLDVFTLNRRIIYAALLIVLGLSPIVFIARAGTAPATTTTTVSHVTVDPAFLNITILSFTKTNTTTPNPNGCYNVIAKLLITWNGTGPYTLQTQDFALVLTVGAVVKNATNTAYLTPNNQVSSVQVFPISPIRFWPSFEDFCIGTHPITAVDLYYFDGITQFSASVV